MQEVREHYLRDDIYCGAPFCKVCDVSGARLSDSASTLLILDTNVVLNQVNRNLFLYLLCILKKRLRSILQLFLLLIFFLVVDGCCNIRLICWRIQRLMMWLCCRWCYKRLRIRILVYIIALGLSAVTLPGNSLFSPMNTTGIYLFVYVKCRRYISPNVYSNYVY